MKLTFAAALLITAACALTFADAPQSQTAPASQPAETATGGEVASRKINDATRRVLQLENGLTIILQQNKTAPAVASRIYIRAGSLTENKFMGAGISHVLEHLVAGATSAKRKESESADLLKTIGNDSNAFTSLENTCYFITTTKEKYPIAIDILADWVLNCAFTDAEFKREYEVVQREIEMGEAEADRSFSKVSYANRYLVHPARHPVIGYKSAFQTITAENAREYYKQMYVPDNMIVSIAGDIDLDEAEKLVITHMGSAKRGKVPAISLPAEPPVTSPRVAVAHGDVKQARLEIGFPTVDLFSSEMYPLDVLAGAIGNGESSILVRKLRDEKKLVSGVYSFNYTPTWSEGTFTVGLELPAKNIPEVRKLVAETLQQIADKGIDPKEIEKVKARSSADLIYGNQTAEQQATRAAEDFFSTGDIDFSKTYAARIKKVTPEQVQAAAKKYIVAERTITTALLPLKAKDNVSDKGTAAVQNGARLPVEKKILSNGITVLLCKNPAAPIVAMQLYVTGGLLAETDATNGAGTAMIELMTRGAGTRSADDVSEFLDLTAGSLGGESGRNTFSLSAVSLKENFPKTLDLFIDTITAPAFKDEELENIRPLLAANIEHQTEDWFNEGYTFLREKFYASGPYHNMPAGKTAVVEKLTAKQIREHYEKFFCNPKQTVIAIYGDFDKAPDLEATLGKIKPGNGKLALASETVTSKTITQPTEKKSAIIMYGFGPGIVANSADRHALLVLQVLLGGYSSPGGSLLHEKLRGEGLVYTVQAMNISGLKLENDSAPGMFAISALGEPKNAEKITTLINQILADVRDGKISDKDLEAARDQALTGHQLQNQTIASQAQDAALDELVGLGFDDNEKFAANIKKVTKDDVIAAAKKYLTNPLIAITKP